MKLPKLWDFLCHANIVLGVMFIVFFWLDRVNPAMEFLGSEISKWLLLCFSLCAVANGVVGAVHIFTKEKRQITPKTAHEQKKGNTSHERYHE